ncbi:synaptonemal complex protein 1-like [Schistocerca nitens]|uniref:synaptonemal complex protein 1-like n=1 Tax=Schistocerca nitens TaxID=7011 RepID=UPI0021177D73|nr:synaptonemal complex protein 1-like [Schistocerca nitens]
MLAALLQENNASLEKGIRKSLKEDLQASLEKNSQETREREERFRKSLKEDLQETKESLESFKETIAQEIQTSQMKIEYNLKKEMQELQEQWKMDINERENKLQKSIDQVQGDVEKVEGKLIKRIEDDIEETKTELGEKITEVTQMQKQCNDVVEGIGDKQNQLAVNPRNAIAVQREEDDQWVAIEGEAFTCGIKRKGTTNYDQFGGGLLKKCWPKSRQCAALEDPLRCRPLSNWKGKSEELAKHLWELNEILEQPLNDNVMVSAIKRRLNQKRQGTVSRSLIKGREGLMKILDQLESIRSQKYKQANDRNREGSNDPRIHINHSSDYRGRGGGTEKPNDIPDEVRSRVGATRT